MLEDEMCHLFESDNLKSMEMNSFPNYIPNFYPRLLEERSNSQLNLVRQQSFINSLQSARETLAALERSIHKTRAYESKLVLCRASHTHSHHVDEWYTSDLSEKELKCSDSDKVKCSRSQINLAESWSTMSIVCLQYQYEELSKRYEALLKLYDERCEILARTRRRVGSSSAQLVHAHQTLLSVGNKYLALKDKKVMQKMWYESKIEHLKDKVRELESSIERARTELDKQLMHSMIVEKNATTALLLAEIRKCNRLHLENLQLKAQIEKLQDNTLKSQLFLPELK